jgi:hypothetical protein
MFINYGWFTHGLLGALTKQNGRIAADTLKPVGKLSFDELFGYMKDIFPLLPEFQSAIGTTMYEMAFGDPVVFTADKYDPEASKTADLRGINLLGDITTIFNMLLLN